MIVEIFPTRQEDIGEIFKLCDDAIGYQKYIGNIHLLGFEEILGRTEIDDLRHY